MNSKQLTAFVSAMLLAGGVMAATAIPAAWNTDPWTSGAVFDAFTVLPDWATGAELIDGLAAAPESPARFWNKLDGFTQGKQLYFLTEGIGQDYTNGGFTKLDPIYVDMLVKFTPMATEDSVPEASDYILRTYVNKDKNLVVQVENGETKTDDNEIDPDHYYRLTIVLSGDQYKVTLDNTITVTVNAKENPPTTLKKVAFVGEGVIDDLYVSHGDPNRNPSYDSTAAAITGVSDATTPEANAIGNWMQNNVAAGTQLTASDSEKVINGFLTDTKVTSDDLTVNLVLGDFRYDAEEKKVYGKVKLDINGTAKNGKINGKIQLMGAANYDDAQSGKWTAIDGAKTLTQAEFEGGECEISFEVGDTDFLFFKPVIVAE
ncbi:MAG: hypothetical protein IJU44_06550 [Kiritimatiellae bacterium]|nr:hypothetical protein [Kiritimatiellia bacterium]